MKHHVYGRTWRIEIRERYFPTIRWTMFAFDLFDEDGYAAMRSNFDYKDRSAAVRAAKNRATSMIEDQLQIPVAERIKPRHFK